MSPEDDDNLSSLATRTLLLELLDNEDVTLNVSVDVQRVTGFLMKVSDSLEDDNQLNRFALITKTKLG